ncbi:prepilin-type N-terminal cleavage/methylation domain-containing protein [Egbenema bharatensis]|uniref:prepilin-type N-terminal cleavage/methylation domain-containing protein n=1 Tax=Egbenema bharatensis TaxID=3463334 RepID=UPI003A88AF03
MAKRAIGSWFKQRWVGSQRHQATRHNTRGFTLLELLVATAIGGGIISGLMFMVVQLTNTDLRESSRSETQREMQLALDYISTELREAVYVYDGEQLATLSQYLPNAVANNNSVPVLAFWKHQPFPTWMRDRCRAQTSAQTPGIACASGSSYSLVVYSLSSANPGNIWSNNARITRYALTEFGSTANVLTQGYVNPGLNNNNFATWPFDANGNDLRLRPVGSGRPPGNLVGDPVTLVDYVDSVAPAGNNGRRDPSCPQDYQLTPSNATIQAVPAPLRNVRSFYACVSRRVDSGANQDVVLSIRGNVNGRPGYTIAGFRTVNADNTFANDTLPALETRVLTRGSLGRLPPQ